MSCADWHQVYRAEIARPRLRRTTKHASPPTPRTRTSRAWERWLRKPAGRVLMFPVRTANHE